MLRGFGFLGALEPKGRDKSPEDPALGDLGAISEVRPPDLISSGGQGEPIKKAKCWQWYYDSRHQPVKQTIFWRHLHEAARHRKLIEYEAAIKSEREVAVRNACAARSALWLERDMARRDNRRPDPRFLRALMDSEAKLDSLKRDARLYAQGRLALPTAPGPSPVALSSDFPRPCDDPGFHRHP